MIKIQVLTKNRNFMDVLNFIKDFINNSAGDELLYDTKEVIFYGDTLTIDLLWLDSNNEWHQQNLADVDQNGNILPN